MSIDNTEIEKYIFDPKNPKKCKSYHLLLKIAKKDPLVFFSPTFLRHFFGKELLGDSFKEELWDIPKNYNELSFMEKRDLFIDRLSKLEFEEYQHKLVPEDLPLNNLYKYSFLNYFVELFFNNVPEIENFIFNKEFYGQHILEKIFLNDNIESGFSEVGEDIFERHYIFFSFNDLSALGIPVVRSSILVTLEENMNQYQPIVTYKSSLNSFSSFTFDGEKNNTIKPLFLKKLEDVDLLLNILQKDIQREQATSKAKKEKIPTIDTINIKNFFSLKNINLNNLKNKKEIYIVGENGDGKTLLLQSIVIGLAGIKEGDVFNLIKSQENAEIELSDSSETTYSKNNNNTYPYIFAYGASRYNICQMTEDKTGYLTLFASRYNLRSPIEWLQYLDHSEKSGKPLILSVQEAILLLKKLLNSDIEIEVTPDNVTFTEKGAVVSFEQLSAGYRGVITIICDLIARLYEKQPYVLDIKDFRGLVLIDEVELHLHPKWKYNFMKKLRDTFPLIQFIVTTHSPTVILGASKEAVFYKIYKDNGEVSISNQIANKGYTNNSVLSSPLFDMETITSRDYDKVVSNDDYIYEKIHQVIAQKIKEDLNVNEDELLKLIDQELDKI